MDNVLTKDISTYIFKNDTLFTDILVDSVKSVKAMIDDPDMTKYMVYADMGFAFLRNLRDISTMDFVSLLDEDDFDVALKASKLSFLAKDEDLLTTLKGWRSSYDVFIDGMKETSLHSVNKMLSNYKIAKLH